MQNVPKSIIIETPAKSFLAKFRQSDPGHDII